MPAYEILCALVRRGIPCAVGMTSDNKVFITALKTGNTYEDANKCLNDELKEEKEDGN